MPAQSNQRLSATIGQLARTGRLQQVLTDDLAELLDEPAEEQNARGMLALLDEMLENFEEQFELERQNEYLADVLERYPNWHPQVEHVRQQRDLLYRQLREARDRVVRDSGDGVVIREARRQLRDWMAAYTEHRHRETALIQDAFTLETGAGE